MTDLFPLSNVLNLELSESDSLREKIEFLERELLKKPQVAIKTTHYFSTGLYAREIFIPKGTLLTGKIHKLDHLNIISQGDISVLTEGGVQRIKAPFSLVSEPGTKRVGYAHEDTVWTTIHSSKETDLEKLELELIAKNHDEVNLLSDKDFAQLKEAQCLG